MTITCATNEKLPASLGDSTVSDTVQMVPGRLYGHSLLTNGSKAIDQRVGPYTLAGTTSAPVGSYTLDQWYIYTQCNVTVSQTVGTIANSFYLSIQRTSGTGLIKVGQTITMWDCRGSYSQTLSAQLRCFIGSNFSSMNGVTLTVYAGTGTTDINNVNTTTPFTGQTAIITKTFTPTATTSLNAQLITAISSLTPANTTQLSFEISWTPLSATPGQNDVFSFSQSQLEISPNPTAFVRLPFWYQLYGCQFYYRKTYAYSVRPGTTTNVGAVLFPSAYAAGLIGGALPNGYYYGTYEFEQMFSTPQVACISVNGASGRVSNASGTDLSANSGTITNISQKSCNLINASGGAISAANGGFMAHLTLSAVI
jgi:hypothetical protein